jgi:hypothetical protein
MCRVRVGFIMTSIDRMIYRQGTAMRYFGTVDRYTLLLAVRDMSTRVSVELHRTGVGQSVDSRSFTSVQATERKYMYMYVYT